MIRLTLLLCAGIFLTFLVAGQDHGQKRQGLAAIEAAPQGEVVSLNQSIDVTSIKPLVDESVYLPAQPAAIIAAVAEPTTEALPETVSTEPTDVEAEAAPELRYIATDTANVRDGPSTDFGVVEKLKRGEAVLIVMEEDMVEGWARIRIEGDGIEGYIATRLLTDQDPGSN